MAGTYTVEPTASVILYIEDVDLNEELKDRVRREIVILYIEDVDLNVSNVVALITGFSHPLH